jgi:hypothetical protein
MRWQVSEAGGWTIDKADNLKVSEAIIAQALRETLDELPALLLQPEADTNEGFSKTFRDYDLAVLVVIPDRAIYVTTKRNLARAHRLARGR